MTLQPADWPTRPQDHTLVADEIHVWRVALDLPSQEIQSLEQRLAPEERLRAERFVSARDRDQFVACRAILRLIISKYLECSPLQLAFRYGTYGKPHIDHPKSSLHFNLSHSHGLAVFAFSRQREVGVDIEMIQRTIDIEEVAERYFSSSELAELRGLPSELRTKAFFLSWTRKEAYIKARGLGLQIPLDSFSVTLTPQQPERLDSDDSACWRLLSFEPAAQFVGAVVGAGRDWQPRYWTWAA